MNLLKKNCINIGKFSSSKLYVFAGQGTQEKGMWNKLNYETCRASLQKSRELLGIDLWQIANTDSQQLINQTEVTQPLLLMSHYLYFRQMQYHRTLQQHDFMIGHSLGQFSAIVNAGSLSLQSGLKLVQERGRLMKKHTTVPHGMLIVKYKSQKQQFVHEEIKKMDLQVACINSKSSIIVAGIKNKIVQLSQQFKKLRITSIVLPVSTAFHCRMLENMKQQFNEVLKKYNFEKPACKIIRNFDCKIYVNSLDIRQGLLNQLTNPVLFHDSVKLVPKQYQLIEVGHKIWLSKFIEETRLNL